ncbi:MAG: hypothetical protein CMO80_17500, partial [Verrucomicrobiales bacterium]|nr:hypothetical protein [Verrucomicrobiales bacterium]
MPNPQDSVEPGQTLGNGRYHVERKLGQGGMGMVWLATDLHLSEEVALKFLSAEIQFDPSALDDMRRETARSRKLSHPNIVRIHDLHEYPDEAPFISMEYVDGVTLSQLKVEQAQRCLPWSTLQKMTEQLCSALDYAHRERLIHRDLKPSNLMLDSRGRLKLADFGIAAVASDSMSRVSVQGNTSGTLAYMSPQQMDGCRPCVTDDIYALGATLYELLSSKPPFFRGDIPHQVCTLEPEPIEERLSEFGIENTVPGDVGAMIMACLGKEPTERPQSAAVIAEWIAMGAQPSHEATYLMDEVFEPDSAEEIPVAKDDDDFTVLEDPPKADAARLPTLAPPSEPRLSEGVQLPYDSSEEQEPAPQPRSRLTDLVVAVICVLLFGVCVLLFGVGVVEFVVGVVEFVVGAEESPDQIEVNEHLKQIQATNTANFKSPGVGKQAGVNEADWRDAKGSLFNNPHWTDGQRLFQPDTLDNCTVVVLESRDG